MAFDITRLEAMRERILLARNTALAKAQQYAADQEKAPAGVHTRTAQRMEEYAATLADAVAEIRAMRRKRGAATAPCTRDEAHFYGIKISMPRDAVDGWYDHFMANGWMVSGKTPMKDWQAALRNGKRYWMKETPNAAAPAAKPGYRDVTNELPLGRIK